MKFWKKGGAGGTPTRIFYACDIHGSEVTYRKFLNAATFYKVDHLVFGGDLMGKTLVPLVRGADDTWRVNVHGKTRVVRSQQELDDVKRKLSIMGSYWFECDPDEYRQYEGDQAAVDAMFDEQAKERLARWIELADERLGGTSVRLYLCGGNDDTDEVLSVLDSTPSKHVVSCENRVIEIDHKHLLLTVGYSTPTPWNTPRERSEGEIAQAIEDLIGRVDDPGRCIFNFHVPPIDSGLDTCPRLDTSVWPPAPIVDKGQPVLYGAGSESVSKALAEYQPVGGLHGHIHESRGVARFGRTPAFNPGSEYGEGILRGLIVAVRDGKTLDYQFTSG